MTRKRPDIPVADWRDDGTSRIVRADELRAQHDKQIGRPTDEAIKRIFDDRVYGDNLKTLRDEMDRFYRALVERVINTARSRTGKEQMRAIVRASDELLAQLSKPPADWVVEQFLSLLPIGDVQVQLRALSEAVRSKLPASSSAIKRWCVAELAGVYKRCTGDEAGVSRSPMGGEIYGPFVRFVQSAAREINIEISPGTIEAWWKHRNG